MFLNEDIADIENPDGICLLTFVEDKCYRSFCIRQSFLLCIQNLPK